MKYLLTIPMTHSGSKIKTPGVQKIYNNLLTEFTRQQTGYSSIAIIGQSCLGSVAVMLLLMHVMPTEIKMIFVFLTTILCMAFNGAVLAQLKSKTTFNILIISVLFSITVIIFNLF